VLKILTIVGARPQFIKAATISRVFASRPDLKEVIVHTGQHFDKNMSDIFFKEMQIPKPDYNLNIASLSHGAMTGKMLEGIEKIILDEKPDWVLVYGDTNSTLAGALAASKLHIKLAHVEAGLRSYNMKMPEEQNRILTDRISTVLFCPSVMAQENLRAECYENFGIQIYNSGDVMYDAAMFYYERAKKPVWFDALNVNNSFALATVHRAENTDNPKRLKEIILALNEIHQEKPVILPLHPRTKKIIESLDVDLNVHTIEPVGYLEMVYLLKHCEYVLTDSGGVQKEAYFFRKRCIVLRDETEWTELVECGANQLVGAVRLDIMSAVAKSTDGIDFDREFYGAGNAANKIVDYLHNYRAT
jgi:UDP-GlcNAc3NAcA epimerase